MGYQESNFTSRLTNALHLLGRRELLRLADVSGVPFRFVARCSRGKTLNATHYLLLCSAIGVHPVTFARRDAQPLPGHSIVWSAFAARLRLYREEIRSGVRDVARTTSLSTATLSRSENGMPISANSYLRLTNFLGVPPYAFMRFTGNANCNTLENKHCAWSDPISISDASNVAHLANGG
jgi:hypothetical protein